MGRAANLPCSLGLGAVNRLASDALLSLNFTIVAKTRTESVNYVGERRLSDIKVCLSVDLAGVKRVTSEPAPALHPHRLSSLLTPSLAYLLASSVTMSASLSRRSGHSIE